MRCFLALEVPGNLWPALQDMQRALPFGQAVPPENFHLTLAFLDDQTPEALAELDAVLDPRQINSLPITLAGAKMFGGAKPKLLYAEARSSDSLKALRKTVMRALREAGITLPKGKFMPHVTLRRLNAEQQRAIMANPGPLMQALDSQAAVQLPAFFANRLVLYRSDLHPEGVRYEAMRHYQLG